MGPVEISRDSLSSLLLLGCQCGHAWKYMEIDKEMVVSSF